MTVTKKIEWFKWERNGESYLIDHTEKIGKKPRAEAFKFEKHVEYEEISFGELILSENERGDMYYYREADYFGFSKDLIQIILLQADIKEINVSYPKTTGPLLVITNKWRFGIAPIIREVEYLEDTELIN